MRRWRRIKPIPGTDSEHVRELFNEGRIKIEACAADLLELCVNAAMQSVWSEWNDWHPPGAVIWFGSLDQLRETGDVRITLLHDLRFEMMRVARALATPSSRSACDDSRLG
jgi:hypothetical protein